jgi:large subunit ribosomal protein L13
MVKSYRAKPKEIKRDFILIDARDRVLGRLAAEIARILQGKHKPVYTPGVDTGDYVVVINAARIRVTGKKMKEKSYQRYSGYPGGLKKRPLKEVIEKDPTLVIRQAVKGMIPHNRLGRVALRKLKIYSGEDHPHRAQKPVAVDNYGWKRD